MTQDDPQGAFQADFMEKWALGSPRLVPPLGQIGYRLPDFSGLSWHPMPGNGVNNWILAREECLSLYTYDLTPDCSNNVVVLASGTQCRGRVFIRGSNNAAIVIGSPRSTSPVNIHFHCSSHVFYFGKDSTSNTATFEMGTDGTSIIVGEDCMFSAFIDVTTNDHHAIVDLSTGAQINSAANILIEPHVWVGLHSTILKGVTIGFGAIVGARSVVTRNIRQKSAVAGSPARELRQNVTWVRDRQANSEVLQTLSAIEQHLGGGSVLR